MAILTPSLLWVFSQESYPPKSMTLGKMTNLLEQKIFKKVKNWKKLAKWLKVKNLAKNGFEPKKTPYSMRGVGPSVFKNLLLEASWEKWSNGIIHKNRFMKRVRNSEKPKKMAKSIKWQKNQKKWIFSKNEKKTKNDKKWKILEK